MFGQGKHDVLAGVCPKRKRQTEVNSLSSSCVKKFKWNGTEHTSDEIGKGENNVSEENRLASTQWWRKLLLSYVSQKNGPLIKSEEIFRENVFVLLYGIDKCVGNPAQWLREDTNFFFDKFINFACSWKKQLLKENADKIVFLMNGNLENKRDLVTNRLNLLTSVYNESLKFIKFSATQKKVMDFRVKELNVVISKFDESGPDNFVLPESSLTTLLKNKCNELNEAWKQAHEYREELRKTQDTLKETHLNFNKSSLASELLKNKNHELNEARKQADEYLEELRKTQDSLREAYLKFNESSLAAKLRNKDHELNEARKQADRYLEELRKTQNSLKEALLKQNESSLATELKNKDHELNKLKKRAYEYPEELSKMQNSLKEAHLKRNDLMPTDIPLTEVDKKVMLDGCLQDKEKQLKELQEQLDWGAKKQKKTEGELTETREQLQSLVSMSREMTQTKQKDMDKKLTDIQTLLLMKNPNYRPSCQIENESLSKEEKMFKDIKAIIEYEIKSSNSDNNCKQNTTESDLQTNSSSASLRVSEYEMHLVTLIAAFLKITPFPVSSHSIYSYVVNIDNVVDLQFVESLLKKFPAIFKEVADAPGSMEKHWIYLDLKPVITI